MAWVWNTNGVDVPGSSMDEALASWGFHATVPRGRRPSGETLPHPVEH